jgi:hypothetical protein
MARADERTILTYAILGLLVAIMTFLFWRNPASRGAG